MLVKFSRTCRSCASVLFACFILSLTVLPARIVGQETSHTLPSDAERAKADQAWESIQKIPSSAITSGLLISKYSEFQTLFPWDARVTVAQAKIREMVTRIEAIPNDLRKKGIPFVNGWFAGGGVRISNNRVDLKAGGSGFLSPYRPGESERVQQGVYKSPASESTTNEQDALLFKKVSPGVALSQVTAILGACDEGFENVQDSDYVKVCLYRVAGGQTAILWFGKDDALQQLYLAMDNPTNGEGAKQ